MADQRGDDNRDTLGSIFDFIFAETQKPPDKRRPIKPTHINGTSETVEALASVLEKPGFYVSDQAWESIDDGLNIQFIEAYFGKTSPQSKNKISTKDLISIAKNPNEYFDKAYQKANPKFNIAEWAGSTYRGLNTQMWARSHGITDSKTLWAMDRAAASFNDPSQRLEMIDNGGELVRKTVAISAVREVCSKAGLGSTASSAVKAIDRAGSINSSADLRNILVSAGIRDGNVLREISNEFNSKKNQDKITSIEGKLTKGYKSKPFSFFDENIDVYREVLRDFLTEKADAIRDSGVAGDEELARTYAESSMLVKNWRRRDRDNKRYIAERSRMLDDARRQLAAAKRAGAPKSQTN